MNAGCHRRNWHAGIDERVEAILRINARTMQPHGTDLNDPCDARIQPGRFGIEHHGFECGERCRVSICGHAILILWTIKNHGRP